MKIESHDIVLIVAIVVAISAAVVRFRTIKRSRLKLLHLFAGMLSAYLAVIWTLMVFGKIEHIGTPTLFSLPAITGLLVLEISNACVER